MAEISLSPSPIMKNLTLRQIFDKHLSLLADKWSSYFDVYETFFSKYRDQKPVIVEVGIQGGGSMQMWKAYFGEGAKIYGIDIDKGVQNLPLEGVHITIGDQSSPEFWVDFLKDIEPIDCFIDDGGHTMTQQILTLQMAWPKIKDGGVYICEDTHTSYWGKFGGGLESPDSFISFSKRLIDLIHCEHFGGGATQEQLPFKDLGSIHFFNSQVVLIKGKPLFSRVFND